MKVYIIQVDEGTIAEEWNRYVNSVHATREGAVAAIEATGAKLVRNDGGELFPTWVLDFERYPYHRSYEILEEEVVDDRVS